MQDSWEELARNAAKQPLFSAENLQNQLLVAMDADSIDEMLGIFTSQMVEELPKMDASLAQGDFKQFGTVAHMLKGSTLQFGCERIGRQFNALMMLEKATQAPSPAVLQLVRAMYADAKANWELTRPLLEAHIVQWKEEQDGSEYEYEYVSGDEDEEGEDEEE